MVENSRRCADRNHRASEAHARRRSAPTVILTSPEVYPSGRWEVTSAPLLLAPSGILVTSARLRNAAHPIGGCHNLLMYHPWRTRHALRSTGRGHALRGPDRCSG